MYVLLVTSQPYSGGWRRNRGQRLQQKGCNWRLLIPIIHLSTQKEHARISKQHGKQCRYPEQQKHFHINIKKEKKNYVFISLQTMDKNMHQKIVLCFNPLSFLVHFLLIFLVVVQFSCLSTLFPVFVQNF